MKKILLRLLMALGVFILILVANYFAFNIIASKITEGEPISSKGSEKTALLVIDIQEGTTGDISYIEGYRKQSEELMENVNRIIAESQEKNWSVIYVLSEVANPLINLINNTMARGTEGVEPDRRLALVSDMFVVKRRNDSFNRTNLDQLLQDQQIGRLVLVGLDAEHCILSAIQAAQNRGYDVSVYADGVIAAEEETKTRMLDTYREMGVEIL